MHLNHSKLIYFLNIATICLILTLPYYIFGGKLFIGGDDSRLFYVFPWEFLKNESFYSWFHFSASGTLNPNQFTLPILIALSLIKFILPNPLVLSYLAFSLPLLIGFIYFQKSFKEIISSKNDHEIEAWAGAVLYIFSPILIVGQLINFLYSAWLIALLPVMIFYFIRYLRTGNFRYVILNALWCLVLSLAIFSIPWLAGAFMPIAFGLLCCVALFKFKEILIFAKRAGIFFGVALLCQAFWLVPFVSSFFISGQNSYGNQVLSSDVSDTFAPTVLATSRGTIFYPLINSFHRQIAFDFNWGLKKVFLSLYDKTILLDFIFLIITAIGLLYFKKHLENKQKRIFMVLAVSLITSLFLFTVNVGIFKQIFLLMGHLPGFAMFRNADDKFAIGFIFIYSLFLTYSLIVAKRLLAKRKKIYFLILTTMLAAIAVYASPIKQIINKPLWTTESSYTAITLPLEYTNFMKKIKSHVSSSTNILSLPYGVAAYSFIKEDGSNNIYAGRSPIEVFTGINDYSGGFSFSSDIAATINKLIINRQYDKLRNLFSTYNIKYILMTKNIPEAVMHSYLFDSANLAAQDQNFQDAILGKEVIASEKGNYHLYDIKTNSGPSWLVNSPNSLYSIAGNGLSFSEILEPALNVMNNQNYIIADRGVTSSRKIIPLSTDQPASVDPGKYKLYINQPDYYSLSYDFQNKSLDLENGVAYSSGQTFHPAIKSKLADLRDDELLSVNGKFYDPTEIINLTVDINSEISIYKKNSLKYIDSPKELLSTWEKQDCNNYDHKQAVEFKTYGKQNEWIELKGVNKHRACLSRALELEGNSIYQLEFDYKSTAESLHSKFSEIEQEIELGKTPNVIKHYSYVFANAEAKKTSLYIYSGTSQNDASTAYKNLTLYKYAKARSINILSAYKKNEPVSLIDVAWGANKFSMSAPITSFPQWKEAWKNWAQLDCNSIDKTRSVEHTISKDGESIELAGYRGHNACITKEITINPLDIQKLEFDYNADNGHNLFTQVAFADGTSNVFKLPALKKGWQHYVATVDSPKLDKMRIYFYSGTNLVASAAEYKNFKLSHYSRSYYQNILLEEGNPTQYPRIQSISFEKTSPIETKASINGVSKPSIITFNDSFHPGWKLYLRPIGKNLNCTNSKELSSVKDNSSTSLKECIVASKLSVNEDLSYLNKKSIFNKSHILVNNFANGWTIDPQYIKDNYSTEYYSENPDGSININLDIFFQPQEYFYLGASITGFTFLAALGYFFILKFKKKPSVENNKQAI